MANQQSNDKAARTIKPSGAASAYPSALHETLAMTAREVEAEIFARGKTPNQILRTVDAVIESARASHVDEKVEALKGVADFFRFVHAKDVRDAEVRDFQGGLESLRFYEESVAAGIPSDADGDVPYRKAQASDFFGQQDWKSVFVARVSGWSMRGDQINDGDVVLVDSNARPKDGDIVLAHLVGEGQVVKRLRLIDGERMVLESANPDFAPIMIDDSSRVAIRGVVKGRAGKI